MTGLHDGEARGAGVHLPLKPEGVPGQEQERHMRDGSGDN